MKTDIRAILEGLGYTIPSAEVYSKVTLWSEWYKGYSPKFHNYLQYNGKTKIKRQRKALHMAKKVCEDHANLLLNEKVQIVVSNKAVQAKLDAALEANNFRVEANKLVEIAYALGTGAFVEHDDGAAGVLIDYIPADMIFPLTWEGGKVTECAFASIKTLAAGSFVYINVHQLEGQEYVIRNKLVPLENDGRARMTTPEAGKKKPAEAAPDATTGLLYDDLAPEVRTGSLIPRFQFIGPNQVNNVNRGSPLGISIFANSLDLLEGLDLIFDSYCGEFRLGKKRIILPITMLEILQDGNEKFMAFDDNDTEFYGMKNDSLTDIKEINMELRIEQHDQGLQRFLNLLSTKCGLGNDRYKFDAGGVKTATEIISEKSELFQNLKKNELVLDAAIGGLCRAVADITGAGGDFEVKVNFDDSIIEDSDAKRTRIQALVTQGKFPLWRYLHEYEGYDEDEAKDIALEAEDDAAAAVAPKDGITYPDEPQVPGSAAGGAGGAAQAAAGGKEPAAAGGKEPAAAE